MAASNSPQRTPPPARAVFARRVDGDLLEAGEVDHDPVVAGAEPGDAVPAAADRDDEVALAREVDSRDDVGGVGAARDQGGPAVDHAR